MEPKITIKKTKAASSSGQDTESAIIAKLEKNTQDHIVLRPLPDGRVALGPLALPTEINQVTTRVFSDRFPYIPLYASWFNIALLPNSNITWPSTVPGHVEWFARMKAAFQKKWEAWGISRMIALSKVDIPFDWRLIQALLCFWNPQVNCFCFPWGVMTPTLLDVKMLLNLPVHGSNMGVVGDDAPAPVGFPLRQAYKNWVAAYMGEADAEPTKEEHEAFLLYWLNRYFNCPSARNVTMEPTLLVRDIMRGPSFP